MVDRILKEKTSADHLLYVSMKYTKTCDVILNLISRWTQLLDIAFDVLIEKQIEKKKLSKHPESPVEKIQIIRDSFKNNEIIQTMLKEYIFFRKVPKLTKTREGEFRKNVNLKVEDSNGKIIDINLEKLKEYSLMMDKFVEETKTILK
jgi:hypothetical protein